MEIKMTYSIIHKSQLEVSKRLDAEYYQPEFLAVEKKIKSMPHETLENICKSLVSFGAYDLTNYIKWVEKGIPFLVAENIKDGFIDYDNVRYIDESVDEILKKSRVKENQVLLGMSGSVGEAAIARLLPAKTNSNQDIVKITLKESFSPYFLAIFLNSKYGKSQVLRLPVGSVQQHIFLWQTKSLLVPTFPDSFINEVEQLYKNALDQSQNSKNTYRQAEQILLDELGLADFEKEMENCPNFSIVNLSEAKVAHRFDAEYFLPKYETLFSKLRTGKIKKLGDIATVKKGIETGAAAYQENGKLFIRVSSISREELIDKDQKYLSDELYEKLKKNFEPKIGEILLTKDASPGVAFAVAEPIEGIICGGILRLIPKERIESEYLSLCINSILGKFQVERDAGGSIITHWKPEQVKNLLVPILPIETQRKIAVLVRQSRETRKKAKELLETAKQKVEEAIENQK